MHGQQTQHTTMHRRSFLIAAASGLLTVGLVSQAARFHSPTLALVLSGIATLNALVETLWQRDGAPATHTVTDGDTFEGMEIRPDDRVVLVGAFAPYMRELRKRQIDYRVLELDISTLKEVELPHYAHPDTAPEVIPWGTVLAVTGTTLINGTLDALLTHVRPGMKVAVIGPTAPLLATPFAQRGVTHIGGARVRDPDVLLDILAEGGSGYHFFGSLVERLTLHAGRP